MKKIATILLLLCSLTTSWAYDEEDEGYWPRSYFVTANMGIMASKGDFNERALTVKDSAGKSYKVHLPAFSILADPDFTLGVNIRCFTLNLDFHYWKFSQTLNDFEDDSHKGDTKIWRLGFEFSYNLFWPESFQIGLGLGYSYTNIHTENSVIPKNSTESDKSFPSSEVMGSAVGLIANLRYYLTDHIALNLSTKFYENWFKSVYTKKTGSLDLDPYVWQTFIAMTFGVQYQF